ncbi:hypothetical protein Tco_0155543 [Tanacetum coccineum]
MNVNYKVYDLVSCAMNGIVASRVSAMEGCDRLVSEPRLRARMDDESYGLDDESHGMDDEGRGLDDEGNSVESDGLSLGEEEEEAVPGGQQQATPVVRTAVSTPLGLGYGALRPERMSAFRQPTLTTWTDPEDGMVYIDVPTYPPPTPPV